MLLLTLETPPEIFSSPTQRAFFWSFSQRSVSLFFLYDLYFVLPRSSSFLRVRKTCMLTSMKNLPCYLPSNLSAARSASISGIFFLFSGSQTVRGLFSAQRRFSFLCLLRPPTDDGALRSPQGILSLSPSHLSRALLSLQPFPGHLA